MRTLRTALRLRLRDRASSLSFTAVIAAAIALSGAWLSIAGPLLRGGMPYPHPETIVALASTKSGQAAGLAWGDLDDLRGGPLSAVAGYLPRTWGLQAEPHGRLDVVLSMQVTGEFFDVLGVQPWIGSPLTRDHEQAGNQNWVWLSYASWLRYFGANGDIGRRELGEHEVWLNAAAYRVAGVMPAGFVFPHAGQSPDIYIPLNRADYCCVHDLDAHGVIARGSGTLWAIGRMAGDVTHRQLEAGLKTRSQVLASARASTNRGVVFEAQDLTAFLLGDRARLIQWFGFAAAIFLLIASANAAGIWLAQWLRYQRQASIQLSLGAPVWRLFADQLAQAALLAIPAATIGLAGAWLLLAALRSSSLLGPELNRLELWSAAGLTRATNEAAFAAATLASLASASLPLLFTRWNSLRGALLANPGSGTGRSSNILRVALAVAQLTSTAVLGYAGILVANNIRTLLHADRGFQTEQILQMGIGISETRYNTDERMIGFHQQVIERLRRVPGVTAAAGGVNLPAGTGRTRFLVDDQILAKDQQPLANLGIASPGLLPMLGIPLLRGRMFADSDGWKSPHVALVNHSFAARFLAGRDPLGRHLRISFFNGFDASPYASYTIAGIIADTGNQYLAEAPEPQIVISSTQIALDGFRYFVRTNLPAGAVEEGIRQAIWAVDPEVERVRVTPLEDFLERALVARRTVATVAGWAAALALLLAGFGVGASLSATFQQQARDLGIRAALGASSFRLAYASVKWAVAAIAVSWLLALPLSFAVSAKLIVDGSPLGWSFASWLAAGGLLGLLGVAAAYLPARRSARVDPAVVLRSN
jgi:predicted permease